MRSSSAPVSREYPTTSETKIAAILRIPTIARLTRREEYHNNPPESGPY
jgi:hypothetical protein